METVYMRCLSALADWRRLLHIRCLIAPWINLSADNIPFVKSYLIDNLNDSVIYGSLWEIDVFMFIFFYPPFHHYNCRIINSKYSRMQLIEPLLHHWEIIHYLKWGFQAREQIHWKMKMKIFTNITGMDQVDIDWGHSSWLILFYSSKGSS
jgi:hypothetical protein